MSHSMCFDLMLQLCRSIVVSVRFNDVSSTEVCFESFALLLATLTMIGSP